MGDRKKMSAIRKAKAFAQEAHEGQERRATREPYYEHCLRVHNILKALDETEDVLIAALLHDVVEDTEYTCSDIAKLFGEGVAMLVLECTKPYTHLHSRNALKIKFADMLDNVSDVPTKTWVQNKCNMMKNI